MAEIQPKPTDRAHAWFLDLLHRCGAKRIEVARILGVDRAVVTRISSGARPLKADELLLLSDAFGVPLPHTSGPARTLAESGKFPRDLFEKAYHNVLKMEAAKPEPERMSTYELLDTVFFVLQRLQDEAGKKVEE